jgi:hypothetical protein
MYMQIEYVYNETTGLAFPQFFDFAEDTFSIFSMLEISGSEHYRFIPEFVYRYSGSAASNKNCEDAHEIFDAKMSKIKTSFKPLSSLDDPLEHVENDTAKKIYSSVQIRWKNYQNCMNMTN